MLKLSPAVNGSTCALWNRLTTFTSFPPQITPLNGTLACHLFPFSRITATWEQSHSYILKVHVHGIAQTLFEYMGLKDSSAHIQIEKNGNLFGGGNPFVSCAQTRLCNPFLTTFSAHHHQAKKAARAAWHIAIIYCSECYPVAPLEGLTNTMYTTTSHCASRVLVYIGSIDGALWSWRVLN